MDRKLKKELIIWGCAIIIVFVGLIIGWMQTPLYHHYKDVNREEAQKYLAKYWQKISQDEKDFYIEKYQFTENELPGDNILDPVEITKTASVSDNLISTNPILKFLLGW